MTSSCECQEVKDNYWQTNANIFLPPVATFVPPKNMHAILAKVQMFLFCSAEALAKSQEISSLSFQEGGKKFFPEISDVIGF